MLVAGGFPGPAPWRHRCAVRGRDRAPGPGGDRGVAGVAVPAGLNEVGRVEVVAHPVPHESQPGESSLGDAAPGRVQPGERVVIGARVVADHGGIDQRDPPDGLADQGEPLLQSHSGGLAQPLHGVFQGRDRPVQRGITVELPDGMLPVPRDAALGGAEPGMLAPGRKARAALHADPEIHHHAIVCGPRCCRRPRHPGRPVAPSIRGGCAVAGGGPGDGLSSAIMPHPFARRPPADRPGRAAGRRCPAAAEYPEW